LGPLKFPGNLAVAALACPLQVYDVTMNVDKLFCRDILKMNKAPVFHPISAKGIKK